MPKAAPDIGLAGRRVDMEDLIGPSKRNRDSAWFGHGETRHGPNLTLLAGRLPQQMLIE